MENPLHSKENIAKIKEKMMKDADTLGVKSRFGFFSIPYPATIGDRYYAYKGKPHERDENGKVITLPRNPQSMALKTGKGPDVYFNNAVKEEKKYIEEKKLNSIKDHQNFINNVKNKKTKTHFDVFKPGGPQELKDYFTKTKFVCKDGLYKPPPKKAYVDKETHKVIIENSNIKTNPSKKGTSSYPNILFSYPENNYKKGEKRPNTTVKYHPKKVFEKPFKPANTMLNGFFLDDKNQYGPPKSMLNKFSEEYKRAKTAKKEKYSKPKGDHFATHNKNFFPSSGVKKGEQGFFSQRYGVPFIPYIAKRRVETSKENYKKSFK